MLGHSLGNSATDAARGTGDDGDFSRHIEQGHLFLPEFFSGGAGLLPIELSSLRAIRQSAFKQACLWSRPPDPPAGA